MQIFRDLEDCYDAVPWRFDVETLRRALAQPLAPAGTLEESVRRLSGGLAEEMVINDLVTDLRNAGR